MKILLISSKIESVSTKYGSVQVEVDTENIIDIEDFVMQCIEFRPEVFKRDNVRKYILELLEKCK